MEVSLRNIIIIIIEKVGFQITDVNSSKLSTVLLLIFNI